MISKVHFDITSDKCFCKDFTKIENYSKAILDTTQIWDCHHRLETHLPDGTIRNVGETISYEKLVADGHYYNVSPEELIFMTKAEHSKLHRSLEDNSFYEKRVNSRKANNEVWHSEETKKKISEANKGNTPWNKGAHYEFDCSHFASNGFKGKTHSKESKEKASNAHKEWHKKNMSIIKENYKKYKENGGELKWNEWRKAFPYTPKEIED